MILYQYPRFLEMVANAGWSTGVVATSSIVHATPASFYAHTALRSNYEEIAKQLTESPVNFFAGGGIKFFAARKDEQNYVDSLVAKGFEMNVKELKAKNLDIEKKYGFLLSGDGMPKMQDGRGDFLPKATQMALEHLSQDRDGFFLMG